MLCSEYWSSICFCHPPVSRIKRHVKLVAGRFKLIKHACNRLAPSALAMVYIRPADRFNGSRPLLMGNKHFGISSSSLRHICAACLPAKIPFFQYDWKKNSGTCFCCRHLSRWRGRCILSRRPVSGAGKPGTHSRAETIWHYRLYPCKPCRVVQLEQSRLFKGIIIMLGGGFLVGFGTRYAGGCTSGHSIMGLSTLQLPSLIATICFMAGGFIMANLILPFILRL